VPVPNPDPDPSLQPNLLAKLASVTTPRKVPTRRGAAFRPHMGCTSTPNSSGNRAPEVTLGLVCTSPLLGELSYGVAVWCASELVVCLMKLKPRLKCVHKAGWLVGSPETGYSVKRD
jgi:hypothetical protein